MYIYKFFRFLGQNLLKSNIIEKWLIKFAQISNLPLPAPHLYSTTTHLGRIMLHMTVTLLLICSLKPNYNFFKKGIFHTP